MATTHIIECISNLTNNRAKTGFDKTSLEKLEQLFRKTVGEGKEIKQDDFKKIVTSKNVRKKYPKEPFKKKNFKIYFSPSSPKEFFKFSTKTILVPSPCRNSLTPCINFRDNHLKTKLNFSSKFTI